MVMGRGTAQGIWPTSSSAILISPTSSSFPLWSNTQTWAHLHRPAHIQAQEDSSHHLSPKRSFWIFFSPKTERNSLVRNSHDNCQKYTYIFPITLYKKAMCSVIKKFLKQRWIITPKVRILSMLERSLTGTQPHKVRLQELGVQSDSCLPKQWWDS